MTKKQLVTKVITIKNFIVTHLLPMIDETTSGRCREYLTTYAYEVSSICSNVKLLIELDDRDLDTERTYNVIKNEVINLYLSILYCMEEEYSYQIPLQEVLS